MTYECHKCKRTSDVVRLDLGCPFCEPEKKEETNNTLGVVPLLRLVALLPFYIVATVFAFAAGMIGGDSWRVGMSLKQHGKGQKKATVRIDIME